MIRVSDSYHKMLKIEHTAIITFTFIQKLYKVHVFLLLFDPPTGTRFWKQNFLKYILNSIWNMTWVHEVLQEKHYLQSLSNYHVYAQKRR